MPQPPGKQHSDGPPTRPVRQPPRSAGSAAPDQPTAQQAPGGESQASTAAVSTSDNGHQALLVVTGADHPGILDDISHYIADHRATIEAVRVVNLRGRFALLMLIAGAGAYQFLSLAADVQTMLDNPGANYGWMLISRGQGTTNSTRQFESRETTAGHPPTLSIEYTPIPEPASALIALMAAFLAAVAKIRRRGR